MADSSPGDRLLEWYRRYIGEPRAPVDVYAGFALFFGGIALGLAGLTVFLYSATLPPEGVYWTLREIALSLAATGLPALLLGVVVLLPVGRRAVYGGAVGMAVCLAAVALFVATYPYHWNVRGTTEYSAEGVTVYAIGLVVVIAATGSALVAHHLDRAHAEKSARDDADEGDVEVTDEDVRRDIDEAMEDAELSWGGVEVDRTRRLTVETDAVEVDRSGFSADGANTARANSVDDAVANLQHLRGGEERSDQGSGTDDQAAALAELRERQRAEESESPGPLARLRALIGLD